MFIIAVSLFGTVFYKRVQANKGKCLSNAKHFPTSLISITSTYDSARAKRVLHVEFFKIDFIPDSGYTRPDFHRTDAVMLI